MKDKRASSHQFSQRELVTPPTVAMQPLRSSLCAQNPPKNSSAQVNIVDTICFVNNEIKEHIKTKRRAEKASCMDLTWLLFSA